MEAVVEAAVTGTTGQRAVNVGLVGAATVGQGTTGARATRAVRAGVGS